MADYFSRGYTPAFRFAAVRGTAAKAVWTPTTSTRIILNGLDVANVGGAAGTIQFRFGNVGGDILAEYSFGATSVISPRFEGIESTTYDRALFVEASTGTTDGFRVSAYGFEIPQT